MASFFEPDSYLFDPSTQYDPESFLTFSSFSDLSSSNWDDYSLPEPKQPPANSVSDASSPTPSDPFEIVHSAFEQESTPIESEVGIFHTPTKASGSGSRDSQNPSYTHGSTSSSDTWDTPITPSVNKSASDTFAFGVTGNEFYVPASQTGFAWDQATPSISGSSYTPPTPIHQAHRITSNPVLSSNRLPRTIKQISSMPALKEEDQMASTSSQWFSGADFTEGQPSLLPPANINDAAEEKLVDEFDWVFGDYGLGEAVPSDGTIFEAFKQEEHADSIAMTQSLSHNALDSYSQLPTASGSSIPNWAPQTSTQDVIGLGQFDFSSQHNLPQTMAPFTIDPMAVMGTNGMEEESSRPSSAPGLNGGEGRGLLSVPMADMMMKSLSSEGYVPSRNAPPRDLFSYAPQQIPSGPPGPQPLYTSDPSPSYASIGQPNFLRSTPLTPTPTSRRAASHNLTVQIHPPATSTYMPSPFPPTPMSATFPSSLSAAQSQPIPMQRAGTNPLPARKSSMGSGNPSSLPGSTGMPAHLARAEAIVQMQAANEEAQRQVIRQRNAMKRVGMAEASVMQPTAGTRRPQAIMGWEGPSAQTGVMPVLTNTPLVTVHPPPAQYYFSGAAAPPAHRVHPPPHPGTTGTTTRPIARLPSPSKAATRKASNTQLSPNRTTPSKARSPSGKRKVTPANGGGGFSWGETTFINFTSDDAEKLLTGVAPSGSQSKRKREEEATKVMPVVAVDLVDEEERLRSKRSRSNE
ncbi:hypothetical protein CI109_103691 [Kwoniella shandongensis]|uniref:Uncharacterized protein n=1 Tax=Kwoniella shandongensis TaxID=1734106 RepID=A0A5M6C7T7_9TREE|nr:uncharacterized protein CI109_000615 [Kwoniella shandongensis]KAA5531043.1 hypothetical protein CI109_000615 [Kwoniella shandongensis]